VIVGRSVTVLRTPCPHKLEQPTLVHDQGGLRYVDAVWVCTRPTGHRLPGWHLGRSAQVRGRRLWLAARRPSTIWRTP
jgi:hypothetical protein